MRDEIIPDQKTKQVNRGNCGIVMPISATEGYPLEHWPDVLAILKAVATHSGFTPLLVSDANDVGIIQKRIIQNLYSNEIVICDVSSKNPNVMFELGVRLAFDKPTIIIKDDQTDYSFDTAPIEHLTYPKDLRYSKILKFQSDLKGKLLGTSKRFSDDPNASTFLKAFGSFHVATLETKEVSTDQLVLDEIRELRTDVSVIQRFLQIVPPIAGHNPQEVLNMFLSPALRDEALRDEQERALREGMQKARQEQMAKELRQMKPDRLPVKKTGPENKIPDLAKEHTESNDEGR